MGEIRDVVGVVLRFPVVAGLTLLWLITIWPLVVAVALLFLVGQPLFYPFLYGWEWVKYAFLGRKGEVLPKYWENYPDEYLRWLKAGFPTLDRWLTKGFE